MGELIRRGKRAGCVVLASLAVLAGSTGLGYGINRLVNPPLRGGFINNTIVERMSPEDDGLVGRVSAENKYSVLRSNETSELIVYERDPSLHYLRERADDSLFAEFKVSDDGGVCLTKSYGHGKMELLAMMKSVGAESWDSSNLDYIRAIVEYFHHERKLDSTPRRALIVELT